MNSTVKISIVTLALKMERTLLQAALSVLSDVNTELIIVHPSPNKKILEIARFLAEDFGERVKFVFLPDESPAEGLNHGIAHTTGEVIGILNGDDFYLPGSLQFVGEHFFSNPNIDILTGSGLLADEDSNTIKTVFPFCTSRFVNRLAPYMAVTFFHQGLFYRKAKFQSIKYNELNRLNWDYEHFIEMLVINPKIEFTSHLLAIFRINKLTISGSGKFNEQRQANGLRIASLLGKSLDGLPYIIIAIFLRAFKFLRSTAFSLFNQFRSVNLR